MTKSATMVFALALALIPAMAVAQDPGRVKLVRVPPDGAIPLVKAPQLGPGIDDAVRAYVNPDPTAPLIGNTLRIKVAKLWDQHIWLDKDGSGYGFEATLSPDGPIITAQRFTWRVRGSGATASLCRRMDGSATEVCGPLQGGHQLYDEWFITYDAVSAGSETRNVHQDYAVLPGRQ